VSTDAKIYFIQPSDAVADEQKLKEKYSGIEIISDNDIFHAACVAMGSFGVIVEMLLKVEKSYYLQESREVTKWKELKPKLKEYLSTTRNLEFYVNPYRDADGNIPILLVKRNKVDAELVPCKGCPCCTNSCFKFCIPKRSRSFMAYQGTKAMSNFLAVNLNCCPKNIEPSITTGFFAIEDSVYMDKSYKVYNLGADDVQAISCEIAFTLDSEYDVVDKVLNHLVDYYAKQTQSQRYLNLPFSCRFAKKSEHLLAMTAPGDSLFIEVPTLLPNTGGIEMLKDVERSLVSDYNGRPHWGQLNNFHGIEILKKMYGDNVDTWMKAFKQFNSKLTFANEFTSRCGFNAFRLQL